MIVTLPSNARRDATPLPVSRLSSRMENEHSTIPRTIVQPRTLRRSCSSHTAPSPLIRFNNTQAPSLGRTRQSARNERRAPSPSSNAHQRNGNVSQLENETLGAMALGEPAPATLLRRRNSIRHANAEVPLESLAQNGPSRQRRTLSRMASFSASDRNILQGVRSCRHIQTYS